MRSLSTVDAGVAGRWRLAQKPHVNANDNTNRSTSRVWGGIAPPHAVTTVVVLVRVCLMSSALRNVAGS